MSIAVCRVPKGLNEDILEVMVAESEKIPDSRLDELLAMIPAEKNEWPEELDAPSFEDVKMRHADALGDFEANGGRGVIQAENIDRLQYEMDMLEFDAKGRWLARYLRNRLRSVVRPLVVPTEKKIHAECRDLDPHSKWMFIMAEEDSPLYDSVKLLDASHICRIDINERIADEIATDIGDGNEDDNFYEVESRAAALEYTSNVSNGGLRECVYYLLELGWDEDSIRASLRGE